MNESDKKWIHAISGLVIIVLVIPLALWGGVIASNLWCWFIVPLGAPPIGIAHAAGLMLIKGFVCARLSKSTMTTTETLGELIGHAAIYYPLLLLIGWILHSHVATPV